MKKFLLLLSAVALVAIAPVAHAQLPVSLKGTIERLSAPGCNPAATHRVQCTDVLLTSATIDLTALEGRVVDLAGQLDPAVACPTIEVESAVASTTRTFHLAILGTRLGRSVTFTTIAPAGSIVAHVFSCSRGFLPLGPLGSILIGVQDAVIAGTGVSFGVDLRTERIPNDPNLVGVDIYYQFAFVSVLSGFDLGFLNPGCFRIQQ